MMAPWVYKPVATSVAATPTLHGGPFGSPVLPEGQRAHRMQTDYTHVHEPRLSLNNDIVTCSFRVGPCLPVASNARVNESRVDLLAVLPAEAHCRKLSRNVILNQDIRLRNKLVQDRKTLWLLEVHSDGPLVAIDRQKVSRFRWQVCRRSVVQLGCRRRTPRPWTTFNIASIRQSK